MGDGRALDPPSRVGDLVWRFRLKTGQPIYLLLEFQSTPDRTMALRMLAYSSLLAQGLVRRGEAKGRSGLPPILPVVLYNGSRPWRAAEEVSALLAATLPEIAEYGPRQRYLLLDVAQLPDPVGRDSNLAVLLFRLERSRTLAEMSERRDALRRGLARASPELRRAFEAWSTMVFHGRFKGGGTMLQQNVAKWRREILAEGQAEGEARLLLRQLAFKFGPLDAATRKKVAAAPPEQVETWAERLLISSTLAEVFAAS